MPRNSRMVAIGYPHHITQRGNNREPVFFWHGGHYRKCPCSVPYYVNQLLHVVVMCRLRYNFQYFLMLFHSVI